MTVRQLVVPVGEIDLAVRQSGPVDGRPVVLLHGLGSLAEGWDPLAIELAGLGFHALAVDLRGHGDSSWPGDGYDFATMAGDVAGLLDELGLGPVDLVGHSLGGRVGCQLAADRPDLLRRMVVAEAPPARRSPVPAEVPPKPDEPTPFDWEVISPIRHQARAVDQGWWDRLATIATPTLWVAGGGTSQVPQDLIEEAAASMPNGKLVTIDGAGHGVHTAPEFNGVVLPFLLG